ncbi:MAG: 3-deoxy-manno-octulosonate cytidylyltransferase [bacterium]|nr:3-deoxy-manno-octulosonate cytidylyltransferase [bacterium]
MKVIGIIPARYKSSRFEGKPLADICGKPMIWWTYMQVKKVKEFDDILVATDDKRIFDVCEKYGMKALMTSDKHQTPTDRLHEVSEKIESDFYISINGDEPLIDPKTIISVIPKKKCKEIYVGNIITTVTDPVEVIDFTNLKVVTNNKGEGVYISRSPIPYPKGSMDCIYKKHVGVYAFNKKALDFYVNTARGNLEIIEDIDLLRYIENHIKIHFVDVDCHTLSVDTTKDLKRVENIIKGMK